MKLDRYFWKALCLHLAFLAMLAAWIYVVCLWPVAGVLFLFGTLLLVSSFYYAKELRTLARHSNRGR